MRTLFTILLVICATYLFTTATAKDKPIPGIAEREHIQKDLPSRHYVNTAAFEYFINGHLLEIMGEIERANNQYARALRYYPDSREILNSYARTYYEMSQFRDALKQAKKVEDRNLDTWLILADCWKVFGELDSLVSAYLNIIAIDSNNIEAYYRLASYYQELDHIDSTIWAYKNMARISPNFRIFTQLGGYQARSGDLEAAEQSYLNSIQLDSSAANVRAYIGLSMIYEDWNFLNKSKKMLEKAVDLAPNDVVVLNRLLNLYQKDNETLKAIDVARDISQIMPGNKDHARRLGLLLYEADSTAQADSIFSNLINQGERNILDYYYSGRIAIEEENFEQAKGYFIELTVLADSVVDGWLNLGMIYSFQDSVNKEVNVYRKGIKKVTDLEDSTRILFAWAATLEQDGDFDESVERFEQLIEIAPNDSRALNYLGYMLADKNVRLEQAKELIEKALEIQPDNGAYLDSYGWVLYRLGKNKKALEYLLRAYEIEKNDVVILEHIAEVYESLGEMDKAAIYWQRALELEPDNDAIREKISQ